jgi:hypothetical protein
MTADLIMLYTGDPLLTHGTIVSDPVFRELSLFLNQYIQHHPQHGEAQENQAYNKDLQKHLNNKEIYLSE